MSRSSLLPYRPLEVSPYSKPYARIVRFPKGRVNLSDTFAGMSKGQTILIRADLKRDMTRIKGAALNAKIRFKIEQHPAPNTILVTSLGPQRKHGMAQTHATSLPRIARLEDES